MNPAGGALDPLPENPNAATTAAAAAQPQKPICSLNLAKIPGTDALTVAAAPTSANAASAAVDSASAAVPASAVNTFANNFLPSAHNDIAVSLASIANFAKCITFSVLSSILYAAVFSENMFLKELNTLAFLANSRLAESLAFFCSSAASSCLPARVVLSRSS